MGLLPVVATGVALLVFGASAIAHLRQTPVYAMRAHGIVSDRFVRLAAATLVTVELLISCVSIVALVSPSSLTRLALAGLVVGTSLVFWLYLAQVQNRAGSSPQGCGCGVAEHTVGPLTQARAAALVVFGALIAAGDVSVSTLGAADRTIAVLATAAIAALITWLPAIGSVLFEPTMREAA